MTMYILPDTTPRRKPKAPYKKPESVKLLEQAIWEADCKKHGAVDPKFIARRQLRDDTSGGLTACIVFYAKLQNCFATRLNNTGIYRNGKYTRSTSRRGLPDVLITGKKGLSIFCEVKIKKDRMSQWQEAVRDEQTAASGLYFIAHDFSTFKEWFDTL